MIGVLSSRPLVDLLKGPLDVSLDLMIYQCAYDAGHKYRDVNFMKQLYIVYSEVTVLMC